MLVVADSSPLIVLVNIGQIQVLPKLFERVTIPPQVAAELASERRPHAVRDFIANRPEWLEILAPKANDPIPHLQAGEAAAINLVMELDADLLLIDEVLGRKAASARNIKITGTIGVLELAASAKLLDLNAAFDRIKQTDFWISHQLLDERLQLFEKQQGGSVP